MHVGFDVVGHLEVDDERNVGNIDTTTSEIGRDEDVALAIADRVESGFSLLLVLAGMKTRRIPLRDGEDRQNWRDAKAKGDARELAGDPS